MNIEYAKKITDTKLAVMKARKFNYIEEELYRKITIAGLCAADITCMYTAINYFDNELAVIFSHLLGISVMFILGSINYIFDGNGINDYEIIECNKNIKALKSIKKELENNINRFSDVPIDLYDYVYANILKEETGKTNNNKCTGCRIFKKKM